MTIIVGDLLYASLGFAALGTAFAIALYLADLKLSVITDNTLSAIIDALPGLNCGSCGYAGCKAYAEHIANALKNGSPLDISLCTPGGQKTLDLLAHITGYSSINIHFKIRETAALFCGTNYTIQKKRGFYSGVKTCIAAHTGGGGENACLFGCMGYGDCQKVCPFDAILMKNGKPVIDANLCTACRKCVQACPRKIIKIIPCSHGGTYGVVACSSHDSGQNTKRSCPVGCIACSICLKNSPEGIFKIEDNLASINYKLYKSPEQIKTAVQKCPTKCILLS